MSVVLSRVDGWSDVFKILCIMVVWKCRVMGVLGSVTDGDLGVEE